MIKLFRNPKSDLEVAMGYRFKTPELLLSALTHPSFRAEQKDTVCDNQRLEFLGDAVLGVLAAEWLYKQFPEKPEGALTRMRSTLTSGQALSEIGRDYGLGERLRMGRGEAASGGNMRPSNLADVVEAIVGAAWLDGGKPAAQAVFETLFGSRLGRVVPDVQRMNPKGKLQEYCQKQWNRPPKYHLESECGPAHKRRYTVWVTLPDGREAQGHGNGKRVAEGQAAITMLALLTAPSP